VRKLASLIRCGLRLGWVNFDAALEVRSVLDADARRGNVADNRAIRLDVDAVARMDVPHHFAKNHHFCCVNLGMDLSAGANGQCMAAERDWAIHFAIDLQVFRAGDMTFDLKARTQAR
jgi:hypothetical protein